MRILLFALLIIFTSCSGGHKLTANTCGESKNLIRGIVGIKHCRSISVANGVIIRTEEANGQLVHSVSVSQCPESYFKFGDIGSNGVLLINTTQNFDYTTPTSLAFKSKNNFGNRPKTYFLNGFLITTDTLKISPNAIQRVQVLNADKYNGVTNNDSTLLINIWTVTRKEVRKSKRKCNRSIVRD